MNPNYEDLELQKEKELPSDVAAWMCKPWNTIYKMVARIGYAVRNLIDEFADGWADADDIRDWWVEDELKVNVVRSEGSNEVTLVCPQAEYIIWWMNDGEARVYDGEPIVLSAENEGVLNAFGVADERYASKVSVECRYVNNDAVEDSPTDGELTDQPID